MWFQHDPAAQKLNHLCQGRGADDGDPFDNRCFRGIFGREDNASQPGTLGGDRHGEGTTDRLEAAIQREFSQKHILLQQVMLDNAGGGKNTD